LNSHDFRSSQLTWTSHGKITFRRAPSGHVGNYDPFLKTSASAAGASDVGKAGIFCNAQEHAIDLPPASWQTERVRGVRETI